MRIKLDNSMADYARFLRIKSLPQYRFQGRTAIFPDEYAQRVVGVISKKSASVPYQPHPAMFDYQRDINAMAVDKRLFCQFEDCGLGKTLQLLDFARHAARCLPDNKAVLIVSPLMVVSQTLAECQRFYNGDLVIDRVPSSGLQEWLTHGKGRIGITNYEALNEDVRAGRLGGLILDESSMLKSHYGKWGQKCLELGRGLEWKLCCTGTPAPNDRIEYANHAVFMDAFPTINSFLARFFVNRGQTDNRWEIKAHALRPFYRALSHWSFFLVNPARYGWKDNSIDIPPIHVHIHDVPLTRSQNDMASAETGMLIAHHAGGIGSRSTLAQIAKGNLRGEAVDTAKPQFIRRLVDSWPGESTLVWCIYNSEQDSMENAFPEAASIRGETDFEEREIAINDFKAGRRKILISKAKVLGFGLNLQIATRQVFSGLQDSYESYYQAVKRSNRIGSTKPLNVHIPITSIEAPMVQTVLDKAKRVQQDSEEQEALFKECRENINAA
jgi:hypothetical protein